MTQPDEMMARIGAAVEHGRAGDRAAARATLQALWDEIGEDGDPLHRCSLAHYMADLQWSDRAELEWDERAMAAVDGLTDARAQQYHGSLQVQGFLPSLHLNLADDHRRLGDTDRARHHLAAAHTLSAALPDDGYGAVVRSGIENVRGALDAGSTDRLPTH